ncbi:MAG: DnaA regulatory inactivator Hda [Steroidobacteraceae bacterium]|nr:DnaA regulatory inactivator Hda [Steroidobacteraceae bacterium]
MRQLPLGVRLRDRASLASFVAGDNAEAVRCVTALADGERPGCVWLHGPAGAGKTHLLQAACARATGSSRAGYVPLADFMQGDAAVLDGWRELDCLCLDDVQEVAGRRPWDEALFRVYRDIEERGARLIVAADAPPGALGWSLRDIASRFGAAAIFAVQPLDEAGRLEALRVRAQLRGVDLPDETVKFLQRRFPRDLQTLYRLLDTLDDAALAAQRRLTVPFVREVLGP